jgi:hypothetical protein
MSLNKQVSITDSDTSSDDTRPIVPDRINKPDVSLKNKILKTINKSLLSSELTGIDLSMLKLNDFFRRIVKRIEKRALERDLDLDLIRSFSCSHLAELRKEDMRQTNMRRCGTSFATEDIADIYMPKTLEAYKLKVAIEREKRTNRSSTGFDMTMTLASTTGDALSRLSSQHQTQPHSPIHQFFPPPPITPPPPPPQNYNYNQVKSPTSRTSGIHSPLSPNYSTATPPRSNGNPNSLFRQIIHERLSDIDHRIAQEISSSTSRLQPSSSLPISSSSHRHHYQHQVSLLTYANNMWDLKI